MNMPQIKLTLPCGCAVAEHEGEYAIGFCPLHAAAADWQAIAGKLAEAGQAARNDCREVLEGREPLAMSLMHAICNGQLRSALDAYNQAKGEGSANHG